MAFDFCLLWFFYSPQMLGPEVTPVGAEQSAITGVWGGMMDQLDLRIEDKQGLEDSSVIDHLIYTFGTLEPAAPAAAPATVRPVEPVEVYDQIRRTLTQHWEYDHRSFLKVD